jgi:UDP-glucose 4-epimerase
MKVLLTGGAGFIGSHVAEAYLKAGNQVAIVDNLSSGSLSNVPKSASFYLMDINAPELAKVFALEKPDIVNHHAAQISVTVSARDPFLDARSNAFGVLNLLECCRRSEVKKLIFISSGGAIYGEVAAEKADEDYPARPFSPYAIHKQTGENYVKFFGAQYGLPFTILRYANVFGPRQDPLGEAGVISIFINKLLEGQTPTLNAFPEDPDGMSRDYVYVEDAARANMLALEKGSGETVNIGSGRPVKTKELLSVLCGLMNAPLSFSSAGHIRRSCLNVDRASSVLGWRPQFGLEEGLKKTVAFFRDKKR